MSKHIYELDGIVAAEEQDPRGLTLRVDDSAPDAVTVELGYTTTVVRLSELRRAANNLHYVVSHPDYSLAE